jgi:hypothetical protein
MASRVGKEGPTASVDFLDHERIWDESRFLFRRASAIPDVADIGDGNGVHRRCVL